MSGIRVFSGIQPSGILHLGNFIGAIQHWVQAQESKSNVICIVDLHAITVRQNPEDLTRWTRELAALLFACGIDAERSTLFVQSQVGAHAEATWLLSCVTPLGWLERMTQFKSKADKQSSVSTGLLTYPILQAADILLYDTDEVPVGEDQKQHVELSRDIAQRFNHLYGETFRLPEPVIPETGARIMALDDPTSKMSKSQSAGRGHAIRLTDSDDEIRGILKRAVTDSGREIRFSDEPERAGVNNLLTIYQSLTRKGREAVEADFASARGYGDLKMRVAEVVIETLGPVRRRFAELMKSPDELDALLERGAREASRTAQAKLAEMKSKIGLVDGLSQGPE